MLKYLVKRSKWIIVAVGLAVFWLTQTDWLTRSDIWERTEGLRIDQRYRWRGEKPPHPDIKLIGLEGTSLSLDTLSPEEIAASETLQLMKQPWPWDRRVYAAVLEKLMNAGAKVVVFDFVFAGATEGDDVFAQALERYKDRVVIGSMFRQESGQGDETGERIEKYIPPNSRLLRPSAENQVVGLVNLWSDGDGIVRRAKYRTSVEREWDIKFKTNVFSGFPDNLEHITLRAAEKFAGKVAAPGPDQVNYIDFQGGRGTYGSLAIENMFVERLWADPPFNGGQTFSNKLVIVGPIAEIFHDTHSTPFGDTPGPEVQAQLIGALLRQSFISPSSHALDLALDCFMVALALTVCLFIGNALLKVLLIVVTSGVYLVVGQLVFQNDNLLLNMTPSLFCLLATGVFGVTFQYSLEQFERRRTRNLLERYVSKNVAKTILEDQRSFVESLRGRKQSVAVLFSDIRGFTSMTEGSDPEKLVTQLNEYFLEMVGAVLKEAGTLQKFIGDAIMAAWGDTHSEGAAEDSRRAVCAALQMRAELMKLNERWHTRPDRQKLSIGIGINHGEIIVGNIGHPQRMEFTVLGDGVNLAARLETATKQFHTDILIGETLEALTRDQFIFRKVGAVAFKGKTKPIEVFTLLSDRSQPAPAWLPKYHEAIQLYRARRFSEAEGLFKATLIEIGGEDFLCQMYLEQCAKFRTMPPPPNWTGSFALSEK
jgi:adenylate cyclase